MGRIIGAMGEGTLGATVLKQKGFAVFEEQGGGSTGRQRPEHLKVLWCKGKSTKAFKAGMAG